MKYKYYIASPFFNEAENIFYDECVKNLNCDIFEPKSAMMPKDADLKERHRVFIGNINAINDSEEMLALIEYPDVGTAFEIGYAMGKNINIIPKYESFTNNPQIKNILEFIK